MEYIEIETAKTESKIVKILASTSKPTLLKDIAAQIGKSDDDTKCYIAQLGKRLTIAYGNADDGSTTVQLVTGPHKARFRKP